MQMLNLGCGGLYHIDWINLDGISTSPHVIEHDLRKRLPYPNRSMDVVYHSHVLEHFPAEDAPRFLMENIRVLKPGGILRIAVPDLENIARSYLSKLSDFEHQWMLLEFFDQTVRNRVGGQMGEVMRSASGRDLDFIRSRMGTEVDLARGSVSSNPRSWIEKLRSKSMSFIWRRMRYILARIAVRVIAGQDAERALREGLFRQSGEIHQWMYDERSLTRLLTECGLQKIQRLDEGRSQISDFSRFELEIVGGVIRKPGSLVIEAIKPMPS